jgi:hypothetical protein
MNGRVPLTLHVFVQTLSEGISVNTTAELAQGETDVIVLGNKTEGAMLCMVHAWGEDYRC